MQQIVFLKQSPITTAFEPTAKLTLYDEEKNSFQLNAVEKKMIWLMIKLRIFYFACIILKHPGKVWITFKTMVNLRNNVWGGDLKKIYKIDGKYYFNQYTPGWPSAAYDNLIKSELRRHASPLTTTEKLSFVF